jgi:VanZ family protein
VNQANTETLIYAPNDTSAMPNQRKRLSYSRISQVVLGCYLLALLTGTHLPPTSPFLPPEVDVFDKVYHLTAYAILAGLLATTWPLAAGYLMPRHLCRAWVALVSLAAIDEVTQTPVGRDCDFWDWSADAAGAALGLVVFAWLRRRFAIGVNESD